MTVSFSLAWYVDEERRAVQRIAWRAELAVIAERARLLEVEAHAEGSNLRLELAARALYHIASRQWAALAPDDAEVL